MKYAFFIVFLAFSFSSFSQESAVTLSLQPIQGKVFLLDGGLGNVTVLMSTDEILFVDTKAKEVAETLDVFIKNELKGRKVRYIVNTHMHWDHTGNNARIGKDATIIAHQNSHRALETDSVKELLGRPNVTFSDEAKIYFAGEEIRLIHCPNSHTNHDLVAYFVNSGVVSMGDMYFSGMYPYIASDGDLQGLIAGLNKIINTVSSDVRIVPGHGPVSTLEDLKKTYTMLLETSKYIQKQIDAGKTLEEIKKQGLAKWTPVWGNGFCKEACWIETVYGFLKK